MDIKDTSVLHWILAWKKWFEEDLSTRKSGRKTIMETHGKDIIKNIKILLDEKRFYITN